MGPAPQPARPAPGQVPPQAPLSAPAQVGRLNQQLLRMTEVLQLAARARDAGREELPFVITERDRDPSLFAWPANAARHAEAALTDSETKGKVVDAPATPVKRDRLGRRLPHGRSLPF